MEQFLHNLSAYELSMLSISIVFTIIFTIQVILTFSGLTVDSLDAFGGSGDDGVSFFTIRNMITFLACMGWTAFILAKNDVNQWLSLLVGIAVGSLAMALNFMVMRTINRLSEDNTFDINTILGSQGKAYTPITPEKSGLVIINYGGGLHEISAKSASKIASHTPVVVTEILGPNLIFVKPI